MSTLPSSLPLSWPAASMTLLWLSALLVVHTLAIGALALMHRVREIRQRRIALSSIARPWMTQTVLEDALAMDNFNNLLQVPVLFHVFCLMATLIGLHSIPVIVLATLYVLLRLAHSAVQIGGNVVRRRYQVWVASSLCLCLLWLQLLWALWEVA